MADCSLASAPVIAGFSLMIYGTSLQQYALYMPGKISSRHQRAVNKPVVNMEPTTFM